jgi:hypothetical protein
VRDDSPAGTAELEGATSKSGLPVTVASLKTVGGRYAIGNVLGRGGMAVVYRATDLTAARDVALKQLLLTPDAQHYAEHAGLFEQEFRTLAQLSHPRIIEVYDYGLGDEGPFYTMELLDGGDLRVRAPVPWREACSFMYDVCSSLALLHSRRLVHRDVSPRNVRCGHDGKAKLIDFGTLVPMGPSSLIVGTPQFVAPEVVYRSSLDARTDLFSLGATFYYTLTGRSAYAAKTFAELFEAWGTNPSPPSRFVNDIPGALDSLILSLMSIDPSTRPRSAFEVMQRLKVIAAIDRAEPVSVSGAYLSTPVMVGRDSTMATVGREMNRAFEGRGRGVLIQADGGLGRSRLLDAAALVAKIRGATVLRVNGRATTTGSFKLAEALAEQLIEAVPKIALEAARTEKVSAVLFEAAEEPTDDAMPPKPELRAFADLSSRRVELQNALSRWFLAAGRALPLTIAVDDVHLADEPSLALLAALASQAAHARLLLVATAEIGAEPTDRIAFAVFTKNSTRLSLEPLERRDLDQLFASLFGDVPNVQILSAGVHSVARGSPRAAMDLAQHLVDKGLIRYSGGAWTLPASLDPADLPASAEVAIQARIQALSPVSRWLAGAQAVATHDGFTRDDYLRLRPDLGAIEVDAAIAELISAQLVVSDGRLHSVAHRGLRAALTSDLGESELAERHRALVEIYRGRLTIAVVRHSLFAGMEARALDELGPLLADTPERTELASGDFSASELAATFARGLAAAERLGRPAREVNELRRWVASLSIFSDSAYYFRAAPPWLERLKYDSGYSAWAAHPEILNSGERLQNAMRIAYEQYGAASEADRAYRPDEAIGGLARYVTLSITIAVNHLEPHIIYSLPPLLEPFAPINGLVRLIWLNALATREMACHLNPERARTLWLQVYEQLGQIQGTDAQYVIMIRNAVAYGVGSCEAWMGMESAVEWAERLDDDPLQQVTALQLRRAIRMQLGDWDGAERLRKEAEVLGLQARSRQMFNSVVQIEMNACALSGDITALKQCTDKIRALALHAPGWMPTLRLAEGRFDILCGNFMAALASFLAGIELVEPAAEAPFPLNTAWCGMVAGQVEALVGLERHVEAREAAEAALEVCRKLEIGVPAHDISRALALAEAELGEYDRAATRLDEVIARQRDLGITGMRLGASFEARARVAILAKDKANVDTYSRLTAREYRHGHGSALGARYDRLMQDAQRVADGVLPKLSEFESARYSSSSVAATAAVTQAMRGADGAKDRAERALNLLCDARAPNGHLYLFEHTGIRLVASRGKPVPPEGLADFVAQYVQRELSQDESPTGLIEDVLTVVPDLSTQFTDSTGARYAPFLLSCHIGGKVRCAGVAAVSAGEGQPVLDYELVRSLANHLIQVGDSSGVEYGGGSEAGLTGSTPLRSQCTPPFLRHDR